MNLETEQSEVLNYEESRAWLLTYLEQGSILGYIKVLNEDIDFGFSILSCCAIIRILGENE